MGSRQSKEAPSGVPENVNAAQANHGMSAAEEPTCPVPEEYRSKAVYNVYNQRINDPEAKPSSNPLALVPGYDSLDPTNMMPQEPNQQPW
jgi:cytochrome c heme-lyase